MSITRIDRKFAALKAEGRAALVTFITAGDPEPETSLAILQALPAAGAGRSARQALNAGTSTSPITMSRLTRVSVSLKRVSEKHTGLAEARPV